MLTPEMYVNQPGGMLMVTLAPWGMVDEGRSLQRAVNEICLDNELELVENIRHG